MHGTSKCFFGQTRDVITELGAGRKIEIISSTPLSPPSIPGLAEASITLKEATKLKFAIHMEQDAILIHNNTLWMSLSEKTYLFAGIEMKKVKNRYYAKHDLDTLNKRVQWSLDSRLTEPLEFLVEEKTVKATHTSNSFETPPLEVDQSEMEDWVPHFYEWVGLMSIDSPVLTDLSSNPAICNYFSYPDSTRTLLHKYTLQGLVTPEYVQHILDNAKEWLVVTVYGFNHSPIAWGRPHHWDQGSEHGYTILKSNLEYTFKLVSRGDL